ncbi:DUF6550 family protein [Desulfosporosinus sp. BG]|uniref:DUF6550 family protein n=1 Tax=Desulfosporosinus sp. BG TaxID=1633135 RepID=UPI00083AF7A3|nr:DUF6550 family protein [Desulfosporosinus sp. BG]ODA43171.1 hypothetical protein DSBG_0167 [Desulfosporosinus sp. BG]
MSKLNVKTQKRLLVSGLAVLCVVLVIAVFSFVGGSGEKDKSNIANNISNNVTVDDIKTDDKAGVSVPNIMAPTNGTESQTSSNVVLDIDKQQDVEVPIAETPQKPAEPEKPVVKDEGALKNPDTPPVYDKEQTTVEKKSSEPKSGDKKDGQVYIPGFGWVKDEGGGSQGVKVGNEGDKLTGNKVGQMN